MNFDWPWKKDTWDPLRKSLKSVIELDAHIAARLKRKPKELFNSLTCASNFSDNLFETKIIPTMQKLIFRAPRTFANFNRKGRLAQRVSANVALNCAQSGTLVAMMFFGYFPECNFYDKSVFSIECLITYFEIIADTFNELDRNTFIIIRNARQIAPSDLCWSSCELPLARVSIAELGAHISDNRAKIEFVPTLEIIGAGYINFAYTDTLVGLLFCEPLIESETVTFVNVRKYSNYSGLASSIAWTGKNSQIKSPCALIFANALPEIGAVSECISNFDKDLTKAYCGLGALNCETTVAAPDWNYPGRGNNPAVKFIQILLAASVTRKSILLYSAERAEIATFMEFIKNMRVCDLYDAFKQAAKYCEKDFDIFSLIKEN